MKKLLLASSLLFASVSVMAQEGLTYQQPPAEINSLVDVSLAPSTILDNDKRNMVLIYRDSFKSIAELSAKEMRLAGLRINPKTNIGSRVTFFNNVKIKAVDGGEEYAIKGLPANAQLSNFSWSPDNQYLALTNTTETSTELWVLDIEKREVFKLLEGVALNANMGNTINWMADSKTLLVKVMPEEKVSLIDTSDVVPTGPTISVSDGKKAQNRTYQDLLKNKNDEANFEQLANSTIVKVTVDGESSTYLPSGMYGGISVSPDGNYVLVTQYKRPFSYLVPYSRFPHDISVLNPNGKLVKTIESVPLLEDLPKGFMSVREGKRRIQWRSDKPATLVYAQALDGGDPANEVEFRDEVFALEAPFDSQPRSMMKTINRFYALEWANDDLAFANDYWWNTRNTKKYQFNPSDSSVEPAIIFDRNYQDRYSDPGSFIYEQNEYARSVVAVRNNSVFLSGDGFTPEGQFPFIDSLDLMSTDITRLYQSTLTDRVEDIRDFDVDSQRLLVRIEGKSEYPNYYFRNLASEKESLTQLTDYANPFESLANVKKEVIEYKRDDGLDLSGTLYLPLDYKEGKKYPMILWAYPREFKDKSTAGQNTSNPNEFTYPFWGSPIYWVTRGYVVLDDAAFPIVGEGDVEPNDSFRTQLVANAKAAIDAVDAKGLIDRERVAVGGHSYGAFMVANLLSHSDLFAAGIARSGAYNRTLTPFGFQSEERSYWEAPDVYYTMSPFMHADKMKTPLLLVHGEADNNSGTYPLQSERYFNALKGLGATARLVMLPKESHGYRAKESILHLLWEQDQWLETYVKNKPSSTD